MYIAYYKKCAFGVGNTEEKALEKATEILSLLGWEEMARALPCLQIAPISELAYVALIRDEIVPLSLMQGIFELS